MTIPGLRLKQRRGNSTLTMLGLAEAISVMAQCPQDAVGALLTVPAKRGGYQMVALGWNAAPERAQSCLEAGTCDAVPEKGRWETAPGAGSGFWKQSSRAYSRHLHAEVMALANAARAGASTAGGWVYVTRCPCPDCVKVLAAAGIRGATFPASWAEGEQPPEGVKASMTWAAECGLTLTAVKPGPYEPVQPPIRIDPTRLPDLDAADILRAYQEGGKTFRLDQHPPQPPPPQEAMRLRPGGPCGFPGCENPVAAYVHQDPDTKRIVFTCRVHVHALTERDQCLVSEVGTVRGQSLLVGLEMVKTLAPIFPAGIPEWGPAPAWPGAAGGGVDAPEGEG